MNKLEFEVKHSGTKRLMKIIGNQADAYSEQYLDIAKSELIRRGETFAYDTTMQTEIEALNDDDLNVLVEKERGNYNLEYIELAVQEYLKRGFKNKVGYVYEEEKNSGKHIMPTKLYPALRVYSSLYTFIGIVSFFDILIVLFQKYSTWVAVILTTTCIIGGITFLAAGEAIKVFWAIEENTRKQSE